MKRYAFFLLPLLPLTATGQEGDYYRLPKERSIQEASVTLPNVNTRNLFLYISAKGGYKIQGSRFRGGHRHLTKEKSNSLFWQAALGLNIQDQWGLELNYLKNPLYLEWQYSDQSGYNYPLGLSQRTVDHTLLLFFKRKILTVDRITRKTRLNLLFGLKYSAFPHASDFPVYSFGAVFYSGGGNQPKVTKIKNSFSRPKRQLSPVIGTEITGRLAESLEIGLMAHYLIEPKSGMVSSIEVNPPSGGQIKSDLMLNKQSLFLGLAFRWNFHHGIRYVSETL